MNVMSKRLMKPPLVLFKLLLLFLFATEATAEGVCKKLKPGGIETHTFDVKAKDWSWTCGYPYFTRLQIQLFNHTDSTINKIIFKGNQTNKSWGRNVSIPPLTSATINANDSGGICGKGDRNGSLTLFYTKVFRTKDKCLEFYSAEELQNIKAQEKAKARKEKQRQLELDIRREIEAELQLEIDTIRDNCIISKSKNANSIAFEEIKRVCSQIAKNPSRLQKWRWGSNK